MTQFSRTILFFLSLILMPLALCQAGLRVLLRVRGGLPESGASRMPAILLLLLALLGASPVNAAGWAHNYGTAGANAYTYATAVDASGNVYIAGYFDGATLTLGSVTLNRIGVTDAFAAKLNASGAVVWAKNFGGSGSTAYGGAIAVDGSGNVYLGGDFKGILTSPPLTAIGNDDAFALKLNASGAVVWAKNFGGSSGANARGSGIAVDGSGNVYLGGYFNTADLTTPPLTIIGGGDAFALKLDSSGNTTWAKNYGGSGAQAQGMAIAVDGSGNVYLGGFFYTADLTTPPLTKIGVRDAFALKLDSSGNTTWAKNYGGSGGAWAQGSGIAVDGSGNVYLGGVFSTADLTTPPLTKIGTADAFALKLDSSGNTTWGQNFGGSGAVAPGYGIAVDGSGNVYLGGYFDTADLTTPPLTKIGVRDVFALKLDSSGNATWAKNYGGSGAGALDTGIAVDGSGNVYLGGFFDTANLTTPALNKIGIEDTLIIKETIVAQGGPGLVQAPIPTLSEWGMILLAGMLGVVGMGVVRRRSAL
jgi:hypothetical protein